MITIIPDIHGRVFWKKAVDSASKDDAPFWKVLIYYVILFVLIEAVRVGTQKCIEKRDGKKE